MSEFDLIQRYFTRPAPSAILGVGDDAALLRVAEGMELAVSTDMLVSGTHFFPDTDPFLLGHKTLAVNLSDLAAMGAVPRWATLALSLPACRSENGCADSARVSSPWPMNMASNSSAAIPRAAPSICASPSWAKCRRARRCAGAGRKIGDDIWVSGSLGAAALGLAHLQGKIKLPEDARLFCLAALHQAAAAGWRWVWRCATWPAAPSIFPTACWPT